MQKLIGQDTSLEITDIADFKAESSTYRSALVRMVEQKIDEKPKMPVSNFISLVYHQITYARRNGVRWRTLRDGFASLGYEMSVAYLQAAYSRETQVRHYRSLQRENLRLKEQLRSLLSLTVEQVAVDVSVNQIGSQHQMAS